MSPNVPEMDSTGRKRSHDEYAGTVVKVVDEADATTPKALSLQPTGDSLLPPQVQSDAQSSPKLSSPAPNPASPFTPSKATSDKPSDGKDTPGTVSPKTNAVASSSGFCQGGPGPKRKRLTAVEKVAKEKEVAEKRKEREEQAAKKAAEKAKQEEEKAARAKEREDKRKQKEDEDRTKAEQRDEKKRKKEEEQRRIQEEKERKARSQPKLNAFFKIPSTTKSESHSTSDVGSPARDRPTKSVEKSEYDKIFKPFFLRENTRLARCALQLDQETKEAKSRILDEMITRGQSALEPSRPIFDAVEHLCLPFKPPRRGKIHHPVKHIMEVASGGTGGGTLDEARKKLASIPQKVIAFSQDVRPPYYGTVTLKPYALGRNRMHQLARRPNTRCLPLEYDYDSEAEWQEEEGEDIDMEDDEEEELDDEDNMDGFLDDTEDGGLSTRRVFGQAMEPESTGICFENEHSQRLDHQWGIDPFSTQYWEPETPAKPAKPSAAAAAALWAAASSGTNKMAPPPAPANAFAALGTAFPATTNTAGKLVKVELMNDVKQAILDNRALSKVGIIDFIFHRFRDDVSRAEVKNTLELVAEKKGTGRAKEWDLKPGHEILL
ncbi:hypothetical protein E4U60_003946 [Claviceps pazoutovae]|uniref:Chromatin assembly factor 1 subunit A n=1 Tax=Claviceps pazoutovae TaxID=1649127 RepID=A0A9P7SF68_9HYPO|nr:hypothetical protein E4U60_003946 [Claviceps pazoutovae]